MCYYNVICNYYVFMGETARKWLAVKTTSLWSSRFSRLVEFHSFWLFFQELNCQLKKKKEELITLTRPTGVMLNQIFPRITL